MDLNNLKELMGKLRNYRSDFGNAINEINNMAQSYDSDIKKSYDKGFEDACTMFHDIICSFDSKKMGMCFGLNIQDKYDSLVELFEKYEHCDIRSAYFEMKEEEEDKIKPGDIVGINNIDYLSRTMVTRVYEDEHGRTMVSCLYSSGVTRDFPIDTVVKTNDRVDDIRIWLSQGRV